MISSLGKRVFLLHNVHEKAPQLFNTRWAMAYLRGPVTRSQVKVINKMVGAGIQKEAEKPGEAAPAGKPAAKQLITRPAVPSGVREVFLPNTVTVAQALKKESLSPEGSSNNLVTDRRCWRRPAHASSTEQAMLMWRNMMQRLFLRLTGGGSSAGNSTLFRRLTWTAWKMTRCRMWDFNR